jgi:HAD superfamily hydrolase (TIGR01509 family)
MTRPPENSIPDFKAVLWDMDGTLVHSDKLHARCIKQIGVKYGQIITDDLCEKALGVSHRHCYDLLTSELGPMPIVFEDWMTKELELYNSLLGEIEVREKIVETLDALHKRGIKQAIFSNNPGNTIERTMKCFERYFEDPQKLFLTVISLNDVPAKPAPDGYLLACERLGVKPEESLVIEDSPTGASAGMAAGCFTIYWPAPESKKQLTIQPNMIVDNLDFLL